MQEIYENGRENVNVIWRLYRELEIKEFKIFICCSKKD